MHIHHVRPNNFRAIPVILLSEDEEQATVFCLNTGNTANIPIYKLEQEPIHQREERLVPTLGDVDIQASELARTINEFIQQGSGARLICATKEDDHVAIHIWRPDRILTLKLDDYVINNMVEPPPASLTMSHIDT